MSILSLFPQLTARSAQRSALEVGDRGLRYAELMRAAQGLRTRLDALGVGLGERVFVWADRELEGLAMLAATLLSGRVLVPINPEIGERELAHARSTAAPRILLAREPARLADRLPGLPALDTRALVDSADAGGDEAGAWPELDAEATCLVLYTSGTTGLPKGARLSPRNIASTLDGLADAWALGPDDTLVHALPVFHAHGLVFGLFGALRLGATLVHVPKFSPEAMGAALGAGGRVMYGVPTMYHRMLESAEHDAGLRASLSAAKLLVSGSAALPARIHKRIAELTGQRVAERYGLSETLINAAARADGPRLPGAVGTALPGVEIVIVDDQRVAIAEASTIGEVAVRGPNVFAGYLGNPAATAEVLDAEGFFYTGDLGTLDEHGTLRIVGRRSTDLIKTGGFKVGAGEVENALLEHPDVLEVAVVGRADEDLGERIVAFVVPRDPALPPAELELGTLVERLLGKHKRPRTVHFCAELPRNAMGKVQKARLP